MFLLFINDTTKGINLPLHLFADDCLLYRVINSAEDSNRLQKDLEGLSLWVNNHTLDISDQHTYLEATIRIHKSLSWSLHILNIITKASRTLNLRNLFISQWSDLNYASDVWDQTLIKLVT